MLNTLLDNYVKLDDQNKKTVLNLLSNIINPIKIYLTVVIVLLLVISISNYYLYRKISNFLIQNN